MLKDRKAKQRAAAAAAHAAARPELRTPEAVEPLPKKSPPPPKPAAAKFPVPKPARSLPPAPPAEIPPEIPALEAFIKKRIALLCEKIAGPNPDKSHADVVECEHLIARLHPHYHDAALLLLERSREWSARIGLRSV